jgi:hypothetical protein
MTADKISVAVGDERLGMSSVSTQMLGLISRSMNGARCCSLSEVPDRLRELKFGSVVILDERGCVDGYVKFKEVKHD